MTVDYKTYSAEKHEFFKKYPLIEVETSTMNEYSEYFKTYICEKGQVWCEKMGPEYASTEVEVEIKGVKVKQTIEVKLFKTEFWSTKQGSKFYYEKY